MDTLTLNESSLAGTFTTVSVAGEEAVNALFDFRVTFLMPLNDQALHGGTDAVERVLLGTRVTLSLGEPPVTILRTGIVSEARALGVIHTDDGPMASAFVRVVPTAWLLTQRRKSRIFQKMYPHEIVSRVLTEAGVRHRWALANKYPRRIYCTQYDETDWAFVTRLLAEEGVFFFFDHPDEFSPKATAAAGDASDDRATAAAALAGIGTVAKKFGDAAEIGYATAGGAGLQVLGDLVAAPEADEEDPASKEGGSGAAGPAGAGDVLVFIDHARHYDVAAREDDDRKQRLGIWLRREADLTPEDAYVATSFGPHGAVRPDAVENRDYDFRRPLMLLRAATAERGVKLEVDREGRALEMYEHHGEYETTDVTAENARNNLDQHRARATVFRAEGVCPRVMPGHIFELHNGTTDPAQEGRYVPVRVIHQAINPHAMGPGANSPMEGLVRGAALAIHEALRARDPIHGYDAWTETELRDLIRYTMGAFRPEQPVPYRCTFECVKESVPARPPRPAREPRNVTETATVVGPRGEDIYTDRYGRVKVQFHWDRGGKWDEQSSCWVRVAQTWAGAGYGFQFVPRVGMEVLVTFLRGDPDRPVITGTLYNGTHEPPEPLPVRKTRSAIRTQSSPEGGGFNELAFEDQAGLERVLLRSQKDLELIANDHHARTVRGGETVTVGKTQTVTVGDAQRTGVQENQSSLVGGNQSASVRGSRTAYVAHNESAYVDGGRVEHVRGSAASSVDGDVAEGVNGSRVTVVRGDERVLVGVDEKRPRIHHTRVVGTILDAAHRVQLHAEASETDPQRFVYITCGDSEVYVTKDMISLRGKSVHIRGTDEVHIQGKDARISLDADGLKATADPIHLNTEHGASLVLEKSRASLFGTRIRMEPESAPGAAGAESVGDAAPNVTLRFTHGFPPGKVKKFTPGAKPNEGKTEDRDRKPTPIANARVRTAGAHFAGKTTDPDGVIAVYVKDKVDSFTVQLFAHEAYPELYSAEDEPLTFLVKLEKEVPDPKTPAGARFRLRNLGYEPGPDLPAVRVDPSTEVALVEYQFDRDLARSGRLDPATSGDFINTWGD